MKTWPKWALRGLTVLGAIVVSLIVRQLAVAFGVDLGSANETVDVSIRAVAVTAAGVGLLAWALLEILERVTKQAEKIWTAVALTAFVASLIPIFTLSDVSGELRATLVVFHLAVAVILIVEMRKTCE